MSPETSNAILPSLEARTEAPSRATARERAVGPAARRWALVLGFIGLLCVNLAGASYYLAPLGVRVRHALHPWLKPSGTLGQSLGLLAAALFFFLWLYPLRKRLGARVAFTGKLPDWLDWHVVAGLLVPWVAATHAGWRFTGMIGLGYAAMFIVYLSGLVGRYLYSRIPRRRDGLELNRDEIGSERQRLLFEFTAASGMSPEKVRRSLARATELPAGLGLLGTIRTMAADEIARRRAVRQIAREIGAGADRSTLRKVLQLARREMNLAQQVRTLDATQRAFRYWHAAHKPVAITALLAVLAHIVVAILFGATWFY